MNTLPEPIVIIGAGHAGGRLAQTLRSLDSVADIILIGEEAYPPYERPPLSKRLLSKEVEPEKTFLKSSQWWHEANIDFRPQTRALSVDRVAARVHLSDGSSVPYGRLIFSTGCRAKKIQTESALSECVFYVRDIEDSVRLSARLVPGVKLAILGAGFIGLEVASTSRKLGAEVTVFEIAERPLSRVAFTEIGNYFADLHRNNGVDLKLDTRVAAINQSGSGVEVHSDGRSYEFDLLVVGIGAVPNDELARTSGLDVDDGIIVDEFGQTSDPIIYAAGDVTRHFNPWLNRHVRLESWQNAQSQAIAVAGNVLGKRAVYQEVPWFWSDQFECNYQCAGAPAEWDNVVWRGCPAEGSFIAIQTRSNVPVGFQSVNGGRDVRFARKLLESRYPVDPVRLGNTSTRLADFVQKA